MVASRPELRDMPDPVHAMIQEEMRESRGGVSPVFLRPMCCVVLYGDDAVPRLLEKLLYEYSYMRIHMNSDQRAKLDVVESAVRDMIDELRRRNVSPAAEA